MFVTNRVFWTVDKEILKFLPFLWLKIKNK